MIGPELSDGTQLRRLTDVALFGPGRVVVLDAGNSRIVMLDHEGRVEWTAGGPGTAPGHLLEPYRVAANGREVAVHDSRRNVLLRFGRDGAFLSEVDVALDHVTDIEYGIGGDILLLTRGVDPLLYRLTGSASTLEPIRALARPRGELEISGSWVPPSARICASGGEVFYANPWWSEGLAISVETWEVVWARRWPDSEVRPMRSTVPEMGPWQQRVGVMGIACGERLIIAYANQARDMWWNVVRGGSLVERFVVPRNADGLRFGRVAGVDGGAIVAFRLSAPAAVALLRGLDP